MKIKNVLLLSSFLICCSYVSAQQMRMDLDVVIGNRPPSAREAQSMRVEEERHPNIANAMHDIEKALRSLHDAPNDFGGHKGQAESDLRQGLVSLRKALYFRLWEDRH
jgi:hypothetical protein